MTEVALTPRKREKGTPQSMSISQNRFGPHCNSLIFRGKLVLTLLKLSNSVYQKTLNSIRQQSITRKKILITCVTNKDEFPVQAKLSTHTIVLKMPVSKVNGKNNPNI